MPNSFQGFPTVPRLPWDDLYILTTFESLDNFVVDESMKGFVYFYGGDLFLRPSRNPTDYCGFQWRKTLTIPPTSWAKDRLFRTKANFQKEGTTSGIHRLWTGDPFNSQGFGFQLENNLLKGVTHGVGGETKLTLEDLGSAWSSIFRRLEAKYNAGASVEFIVDGISKGTITTTLPNPATTTDAEYIFTPWVVQVGAWDLLKLSYFMFWQEA